jgi:hypothetical protein
MLGHDFQDMPGRSTETGDNPHETVMLLRCKWCNKTPVKAREDGCPIRELDETGSIVLSMFNPSGVGYFNGRTCVTCRQEIMGHKLYKGTPYYWCEDGRQSEGINDCIYDVSDVQAPTEQTGPKSTI